MSSKVEIGRAGNRGLIDHRYLVIREEAVGHIGDDGHPRGQRDDHHVLEAVRH